MMQQRWQKHLAVDPLKSPCVRNCCLNDDDVVIIGERVKWFNPAVHLIKVEVSICAKFVVESENNLPEIQG